MNILDDSGDPKYTDFFRDQISSKSIVRGLNLELADNVQSYNFSVGPTQIHKPLLSNWVAKIKILTNADIQPLLASDIAPSINMALNGWQYIHYYANQQKIDELSEHVAEVSAIRTRLEKSKSWFDSFGKNQMWDSKFRKRQNKIISDAPADESQAEVLPSNTLDLPDVPNITFAAGNNLTIGAPAAGTSLITLVNGTLTHASSPIKVGDLITFNNATHGNNGRTVSVNSITAATTFIVSPALAAHVATAYVAGDVTIIRKSNATVNIVRNEDVLQQDGKNRIEIQFKMPLGICYVDEMPPGDYEFRIRGFTKSEFAKRLINSIAANKSLTTNFKIEIEDFYYYPYIGESPTRIDNTEIIKTFKCYQAQKKKVLSSNNQLQFTMPSNLHALGFGLMDNRIGSDTRYNPSVFRVATPGFVLGEERKIIYYQLRYAGKYKPEPAQLDEFSIAANNQALYFVQSYEDTHKNSGSYYYEGAGETFDDYMLRGPLYFWQWPRDKNSYATEARLDIKFSGADISNMDAVMFCCFYREIKLTIQDGKITSVERSD